MNPQRVCRCRRDVMNQSRPNILGCAIAVCKSDRIGQPQWVCFVTGAYGDAVENRISESPGPFLHGFEWVCLGTAKPTPSPWAFPWIVHSCDDLRQWAVGSFGKFWELCSLEFTHPCNLSSVHISPPPIPGGVARRRAKRATPSTEISGNARECAQNISHGRSIFV